MRQFHLFRGSMQIFYSQETETRVTRLNPQNNTFNIVLPIHINHIKQHSAAISKQQRLYDAGRVTRLPDRADGKLLPRMRTMKSPSSFSIGRQRRLRDAAALYIWDALSSQSDNRD